MDLMSTLIVQTEEGGYDGEGGGGGGGESGDGG